MKRDDQGLVLLCAAILLLGLGFTNGFLTYLKPDMRPWLLVSGGVLAVLALATFLSRAADDHHHHEDGDGHHGRGWLPWLLVLPFAVVVIVRPVPLGSFMATRQGLHVPSASEVDDDFDDLPEVINGARPLTLTEFATRALYDESRSLEGQKVRLTGFVTRAPRGVEGFVVTRFVVTCCAADATPVNVAIQASDAPSPKTDTWVEVEGTWTAATGAPTLPLLHADNVRSIPRPRDPYER